VTDSRSQPATSRPRLLVSTLQRAAVWLVMVPVILVVLSPIGDAPLPTADGWRRIALLGVPLILISAVLDAATARAERLAVRAFGNGFATALVLLVLASADRIADGGDLQRLLTRSLVITPVIGAFLGLPTWVHGTYLTKNETA
jgi:hypothetical protein